jgi:GH15 family glucan-1,4-alpha-glucosidase
MYEYGLIGDMSSAALVGTDGSINWCCFPRFDSPSVFGAILDPEVGGRFRISPVGPGLEARQEYLADTNILETTFRTGTGTVSITDFMPISDDDRDGKPDTLPSNPPEIHRIVTCHTGEVELRCDFQPRHDYARTLPGFRPLRGIPSVGAVEARGGGQTLFLFANIPLPFDDRGVTCDFTLAEGQTATFVLAFGLTTSLERLRTTEKLDLTRHYWQELVAGMGYEGLWRNAVVRSFLVLHLMIYRRTGAIVAAPTTSLPETIGGSRNWDYRFSWLRDASFTVDVLYRLGDTYGGDRYIHWLLEQCQLHRRRTRIVYGISPDSSLREYTLDHLKGYENSRPVRIGNAAAEHIQMDVFGEVILSIHSLLVLHGTIPAEAWELVNSLAETVMDNWRRKDRGVWEVRGEQQHFVYSKVMCWAALDYAAYIAAAMGHRQLYRRWSLAADNIKSEILDSGWSSAKGAFRQRYGNDALDASNLAIPFMGLVPRDDPRVRHNVDAIERELTDGPLVWRYLPEETDDGLEGQPEGAFTLLSFWLIGNLIYTGQTDRAFDYFHEMITRHANHLGLFAEMIDKDSNRQLGNFPQAYSHTGLIHTALNLSGYIVDTPTRRANRPQ